jgi:multiple sugar transport system substrate-binding protein
MEAEGKTFNYVIEQQPWGDYFTKLPLEVNNGRGPDIFYVHTAYMDTLGPISKELNLSEETMSQLTTTDMYLGDNGKPIVVPTLFTSMIMYANKKIVGEMESIPSTWDEFFAESVKYNDPANGIIGYDYSFHMLYDLAYQAGERLTDENGAVFSEQALQQVVDWTDAGYMDYLTYGQNSPEDTLYQDSAAFIYGAGWMEFWAPEEAQLHAFPVPGITNAFAELTFGISKNVSDEKYEVLNDFVEFMLTDEETVTAIVKGNSGAANNTNVDIVYEEGTAGYAVQQAYNSGNAKVVIVPSSLEQVYRTMLESALTGVPVAEAVAEAKISAESIDVSELHQMEQAAFN